MLQDPKLRFDICCTRICPTVSVTVVFDGRIIKKIRCDQSSPCSIEISCPDQDQQRVLEIHLDGKKHSTDDNIIELMVFLNNFHVDYVELDRFLYSWQLLEYHHTKNTDIPTIVEPFDGGMGYDGFICFKFTSPIYTWLRNNYRHYTK